MARPAGVTLCALVSCAVLAGCGARSSLLFGEGGEGGDGTNPAGVAAATSGGAGGGGSAACPVEAFEGSVEGAVRLELDTTHAYWTTRENQLQRGDQQTGEVQTLASLTSVDAALALAGPWLYFADGQRIARVSKEGGDVEVLATGAFVPMDLAVRGETVYFLDRGSGIYAGTLYVWTAAQGLVSLLGGLEQARAIGVDEAHIYLIAGGLLAGDGVVPSPLLRMPRSGAPVEVLADEQTSSFGLELDDDEVYWGTVAYEDPGPVPRLFALAKGRGEVRVVATFEAGLPVAFALGATSAYVTMPFFPLGEPTYSKLLRAPLDGGAPETVDQRERHFFTEPAVKGNVVAWSVQRNLDASGPLEDVLLRCDAR